METEPSQSLPANFARPLFADIRAAIIAILVTSGITAVGTLLAGLNWREIAAAVLLASLPITLCVLTLWGIYRSDERGKLIPSAIVCVALCLIGYGVLGFIQPAKRQASQPSLISGVAPTPSQPVSNVPQKKYYNPADRDRLIGATHDIDRIIEKYSSEVQEIALGFDSKNFLRRWQYTTATQTSLQKMQDGITSLESWNKFAQSFHDDTSSTSVIFTKYEDFNEELSNIFSNNPFPFSGGAGVGPVEDKLKSDIALLKRINDFELGNRLLDFWRDQQDKIFPNVEAVQSWLWNCKKKTKVLRDSLSQ